MKHRKRKGTEKGCVSGPQDNFMQCNMYNWSPERAVGNAEVM